MTATASAPAPGVYVILATPFDARGDVDEGSLTRLVDFSIATSVHGLTVLGIMGEFHRLGEDERRRVAEIVVRQASGRVPVVVGASHPGVRITGRLAEHAAEVGAVAIMVAPPSGTRPDADALVRYYRAVADASPLPIVVQDEPQSTGVQMTADALARILKEIPSCIAIKLEDPPTPQKVSRLRKLLAGTSSEPELLGGTVPVYGGMGGLYFLEELERGAIGTMTGFAYPEVLVAIYNHIRAGRADTARELFYRWTPLIRYEAQPGIGLAIRKEILYRRGAIASPALRAPGVGLDDETKAELQRVLQYAEQLR